MKSSTTTSIEKKYKSAKNRISQERGDFLLPQVVDYVKKDKWIDPRPVYQRREVWDIEGKSRFLESLLMNLPVPPLFLFEHEYGRWEIMDGQQRTMALVDFYSDNLALKGLAIWGELNGKTYSECPEVIKAGFDRRRIQVTTILAESQTDVSIDMRKEVFERLNTGGKPLNAQELRNCLHAGNFADLLDELSSNKLFTDLWRIPAHKAPKDMNRVPAKLANLPFFNRMHDCEMILRYFAFNHKGFLKGAVKRALDDCMEKYQKSSEVKLQNYRDEFLDSLEFVHNVFGVDAIIASGQGNNRPAKKLYDAMMAIAYEHKDKQTSLQKKKDKVRRKIKQLLADEKTYETLIERHDNKASFEARVDLIYRSIRSA